jgi:putative transposase
MDFIHKHTTRLVEQYDGICLEDLSIRGLAKTKLAKSMLDASHGRFRQVLEGKAWRRGHNCTVIGRFYPSSKQCGSCGEINTELALKDRVWTCLVCGMVHDRDLNAACNIKQEGYGKYVAAGHADTRNAWGGGVRPGDSRAAA